MLQQPSMFQMLQQRSKFNICIDSEHIFPGPDMVTLCFNEMHLHPDADHIVRCTSSLVEHDKDLVKALVANQERPIEIWLHDMEAVASTLELMGLDRKENIYKLCLQMLNNTGINLSTRFLLNNISLMYDIHPDRPISSHATADMQHRLNYLVQDEVDFDMRKAAIASHITGVEIHLRHKKIVDLEKELNIPKAVLDLVTGPGCVIAGGAATGVGRGKLASESDVDIFVFDIGGASELCTQLVKAIESSGKYILCVRPAVGANKAGGAYQNCVVHAIGDYGVRRIQVIRSEAKEPWELVNGFDFDALKAWCKRDGVVFATGKAIHAWTTGVCEWDNKTVMDPKRIAKMQRRNFRLSDQLKKMITTDEHRDFEVHPCLIPGEPAHIRNARMIQNHGLKVITMPQLSTITSNSLVKVGQGYSNCFINPNEGEPEIDTIMLTDKVQFTFEAKILDGKLIPKDMLTYDVYCQSLYRKFLHYWEFVLLQKKGDLFKVVNFNPHHSLANSSIDGKFINFSVRSVTVFGGRMFINVFPC
jgi:hypothetical protein